MGRYSGNMARASQPIDRRLAVKSVREEVASHPNYTGSERDILRHDVAQYVERLSHRSFNPRYGDLDVDVRESTAPVEGAGSHSKRWRVTIGAHEYRVTRRSESPGVSNISVKVTGEAE